MQILEEFFLRFDDWLLKVAAESSGYVVLIALIAGAFNAIVRFISRSILLKIGVEHFQKLHESWKWIGIKVIMSMAIMKADRCGFYNIYNGLPYFNQSESSETGTYYLGEYTIRSKSVSKAKWKGTDPLPEYLDLYQFKDLLKFATRPIPVQEILRADLPENSILRNVLISYGIEGFILTRIDSEDKTKLYGFVVHTYSDVRIMPRNILVRYDEHLKDLRNSIKFEYETILENSFRAVLKKAVNDAKNYF